jgi:hypothetical protein
MTKADQGTAGTDWFRWNRLGALMQVVPDRGIPRDVEPAEYAAGSPVRDGIVADAFGRVGGREDVFAAGPVDLVRRLQ